ncbi:MFS transporter [Kitasatospora sp. NPDC006697]|uniref:MFS transporter n=1 Tax=Kitasatospora sp. NPDC006697 TaxID=3364020 RepID=UPI0036979EAF
MGSVPRTVRLLVVARAVNRLGAFSLPFLTVLLTTRYHASAVTAGGVVAAFGIATIPSRLAGGRLADRLGRRRTIVLGLTGCAVAQVGIAAARGLAVAALSAVLLGLCYEVYEPPSQAMIADATGDEHRVRAYGLLNAALAAAGMGAGLLAAGVGRWDLRWLFAVDAGSCLACAVIVRLVLPPDCPSDTPRSATPAPWRDRRLLAMLAAGTLFALVYLQIMLTLPLSLADRGLHPADAGLLMTASAATIVAGQPLLRRTSLPTAPAFAVGCTLLAAGLAGYAAARTLPALLAVTVLWSLGDLLLVGRAHAAVATLAPTGATARYLAVYGTSWGVAGVAAPVLGTQLLQHLGPAGLWLSMSGAALVLAAGYPLALRVPRPGGG